MIPSEAAVPFGVRMCGFRDGSKGSGFEVEGCRVVRVLRVLRVICLHIPSRDLPHWVLITPYGWLSKLWPLFGVL